MAQPRAGLAGRRPACLLPHPSHGRGGMEGAAFHLRRRRERAGLPHRRRRRVALRLARCPHAADLVPRSRDAGTFLARRRADGRARSHRPRRLDRGRPCQLFAGSAMGAQRYLSGPPRHAHPDALPMGGRRAYRSRPPLLAQSALVGRDPLRPASAVEPRRHEDLHRLGPQRRSADVRHGCRPARRMKRVLVLMYHIVAEPRSSAEARYCCAPVRFDAQMRHLRDGEIELVSLDAIEAAIEGRAPWPEEGVAVTFDDGFADTFANALPVLERYRIPATMFAVSDRVGDTNRWMSERGFPERQLMS